MMDPVLDAMVRVRSARKADVIKRALIAEGVRRAAWSAIELACECRAIRLVGATRSHELQARELLSLADRIESGEDSTK